MIKKIRIQNFRSLEDVTLEFQDVNLLIGPNNSGKSNLFKAFKFLGDVFRNRIDKEKLVSQFFLKKINREDYPDYPPIFYTIQIEIGHEDIYIYAIQIFGLTDDRDDLIGREFVGLLNKNYTGDIIDDLYLNDILKLKEDFYDFTLSSLNNTNFKQSLWESGDQYNELLTRNSFTIYSKKTSNSPFINQGSRFLGTLLNSDAYLPSIPKSLKVIFRTFQNLKIYSINISTLKGPYPTLEDDRTVIEDASNLIAFLDNMDDSNKEIIYKINESLKECIKEFETIVFDKVKLNENHSLRKIFGDKTFKKLGVKDQYGQKYWSNELSDGTLYFLALLSIIHQPNPPKILLLEEPENGIHPRRIKEIIDYIFELAETKGIQVFLTTHSTVVIDEFKDSPESIFVFDKPEKSTVVKNLQYDIIAEDKQKSKELNLPEIDLSGSLGEHWASGLIGGVPR